MSAPLTRADIVNAHPPSVGAAQAYIEGLYGGPTEETDLIHTASVSPSRVVPLDPERLALTFINLGVNTVYLLFSDVVSPTRGIVLDVNGGGVSLNIRSDQTLPTREWWVVTETGTSDLTIIATRRYALTEGP